MTLNALIAMVKAVVTLTRHYGCRGTGTIEMRSDKQQKGQR